MSNRGRICIILKPETINPEIRECQAYEFLDSINFPSAEFLIRQLLEGISDSYQGPFVMRWTEDTIRIHYNQPHHFLFEKGYKKNRVDTLVDIYNGYNIQIYIIDGDNSIVKLLLERKRELRRKYCKNPDTTFYSIFHVSDSIEDSERELRLYNL